MNIGDRRAKVRFEVVGVLRAMLEVTESAEILNISTTGALITCPLVPPVDSHLSLQIPIGLEDYVLPARVRHHRLAQETEDGRRQYSVGVEFIAPNAELSSMLATLGSPFEEF